MFFLNQIIKNSVIHFGNFKEVVERYKGQGDKTKRLNQDKLDAQEKIAKLRDEKENLIKKFEEMKYSGEQKMSE